MGAAKRPATGRPNPSAGPTRRQHRRSFLLLGFLELLIDLLNAAEEAIHGRQQLLLDQGDLLFSIGVINPGARHQPAAALNCACVGGNSKTPLGVVSVA